ncbi:hypothetical protein D3C78_1478730 [compost metagenome]
MSVMPAKISGNPCRKLCQLKRLRHVIVRAKAEAKHLVGAAAPGAQNQHRYIACFADAAANLNAVQIRQADIQNDIVRLPGS